MRSVCYIVGAALRVATTANKPGLPPQYTVVSVAQPRVIQASQITQVNTGVLTLFFFVVVQHVEAGYIVTT